MSTDTDIAIPPARLKAQFGVEGPVQIELRSSGEAFLLVGKVACELGQSTRGFRLLTPGDIGKGHNTAQDFPLVSG